MVQTQTIEKPCFETVWATLQEVSAMQKETNRQLGKLGGRFGEMIEYMVVPNLLTKFKKLGLVFDKAYRNTSIKDDKNNIFTDPLRGWRRAEVTEHRTRLDWAWQIKKLITVDFPHVKKIVLVMDNLNIHSIGSLYKAFPSEEARRYRNALEIHFTPKHGSWLNMAEIEINVLVNHGLSKRVPTMRQMRKEVAAWNKTRNKSACKINWRFSTENASAKLKRLYPQFE